MEATRIQSAWQGPGAAMPRALFAKGQAGALWDATIPSTLFSDTAGTTVAALAAGVARVNDRSGSGINLVQATAGARPLRGRRPVSGARNILPITEAGLTSFPWRDQVVQAASTIPGFAAAVQFGDNSVGRYAYVIGPGPGTTGTLSLFVQMDDGLAPVVGNAAGMDFTLVVGGQIPSSVTVRQVIGALYRVSASWPSGANFSWGVAKNTYHSARGFRATGVNLSIGSDLPPYEAATSLSDVARSGAVALPVLGFDLSDDALATAAIAGGLNGQALIAGDGGICVTDLVIAPGSAFTLGGSGRNWTGADQGMLRAATANSGRLAMAAIRAGTFSAAEIAAAETWARSLGVPGLMGPTGANLLNNGGFASGSANWTVGAGWGVSTGQAVATATSASLLSTVALTPQQAYCVEFNMTAHSAGTLSVRLGGAPAATFTGTGPRKVFFWATTSTGVEFYGGAVSCQIDDIVVRPFVPRS